MSIYTERGGSEPTVYLLQDLRIQVERYGIDSVLGALSDACLLLATQYANRLISDDGAPEIRRMILLDYDKVRLAHQQLFATLKAMERNEPLY